MSAVVCLAVPPPAQLSLDTVYGYTAEGVVNARLTILHNGVRNQVRAALIINEAIL